MARDINIKNVENKEDYDVRCKIFKRIEGTQTYDPKVKGIFYAKEIAPFQETNIILNGNVKTKRFQATIETLDQINILDIDDYVLYQGNVYRVESKSSISISSQAYTIRPVKQTTIVLVK
jgi:hypothetical protein